MTIAQLIPPNVRRPATGTTENLDDLARVPFDQASFGLLRTVYGVPYIQLDDGSGGQLWVTRHGWPHVTQLDPARWYTDAQYRRRGKRLSGGSGSVFRVKSEPATGTGLELVVKFSRVGQEVMLDVPGILADGVSQNVLDSAVFNDPFQEFGLLEEMRTSTFGPDDLHILTKRPLAIYSPPRDFQPWQLGRMVERFYHHQTGIERDQAASADGFRHVELSLERQYVMLFHWVRGIDAQVLWQRGQLSEGELRRLVTDVVSDLAAKGFRVLDTKPNHIILRPRIGGGLLRRRNRLVYALVDFELLQRTEAYERWRHGDAWRFPG
jgi:hypothetical protein